MTDAESAAARIDANTRRIGATIDAEVAREAERERRLSRWALYRLWVAFRDSFAAS